MRHLAPARLAALAAAAVLLAAPAAARAQFTVYTSLAAFLAATSGAGTDSFDDLPADALTTPLARSAGPWAYTASTSTTSGFFGVGPGADRWLSANTATDVITFAGFAPGVRGVGAFFFGTDLAGALRPAATLTLRATDALGAATRTLVNPGATTFLGFVAAGPITALTLEVDPATQNPADPTFPTVNGLVLAGPAATAVIPEPATVVLVAAGGAALAAGAAARRRRAA